MDLMGTPTLDDTIAGICAEALAGGKRRYLDEIARTVVERLVLGALVRDGRFDTSSALIELASDREERHTAFAGASPAAPEPEAKPARKPRIHAPKRKAAA
jgi:hypothetical protein